MGKSSASKTSSGRLRGAVAKAPGRMRAVLVPVLADVLDEPDRYAGGLLVDEDALGISTVVVSAAVVEERTEVFLRVRGRSFDCDVNLRYATVEAFADEAGAPWIHVYAQGGVRWRFCERRDAPLRDVVAAVRQDEIRRKE